jgi:putative membrane protein
MPIYMRKMMSREKSLILALLVLLLIMALSAIHPYDRTTWFMEVAPIFIALPVMIATYRRFPLSTLLYVLIFIHALVLIAGGHYSYARVPLGFWIEHAFSLGRNPYDKIGHFLQGFVPFLVTREILLRGGFLVSRRMAAFLSVCVAMAISAWYELIEWWSALALGQGADEFLGTQGDPWDTQSDMFFAFIGAIAALMLLTRLHDRIMDRMKQRKQV